MSPKSVVKPKMKLHERAFKGMKREEFKNMCQAAFEKYDVNESGYILPGYSFS
jgi:hypothetical protein